MDKNTKNAKKEIIYWSKRLYEQGMSPSVSGNVSVRDGKNYLVTASGTCLNDLKEPDIVLINDNGETLRKTSKNPTSEKHMHIGIYKTRKDINAIIHSHCPILTAFAVSATEIKMPILPDFALNFGKVKLVPYFCPSTKKLANAVKDEFKSNNVVLLQNHGIILGAQNLQIAFYQLEALKAYVQTLIYSKIIGKPKTLTKNEIEEIKKVYLKK